MGTEQYSIGYEEGYQTGWNAAMEAKPEQPAQRTWVGLTDEEWNEITWGNEMYDIIRMVESKLREKNT